MNPPANLHSRWLSLFIVMAFTLVGWPAPETLIFDQPQLAGIAGFSPLSDLTRFAMTTPGGIKVETDGRVGLCRVVVQPKLNAVAIDYGWKPEQENTSETVKAFLISGVKQAPRVMLNGQLVKPTLRKGVFVVEAKR